MDTTNFLPPVKDALTHFARVFQEETAYSGPLGAAWAPGRVNLIGEHTDYNGGYVLPLAVDRVAAFAGRPRGDATVRLWSAQFSEHAQFSLTGLPETFQEQRERLPDWARYILGVATELIRAEKPLHGFDAVVSGDVPLGGGMSSSAALEVATAHACALFSQDGLTIGTQNAGLSLMEVAALCQRAEHIASGLRSGILDQAASCLGQPGRAILLDCRSLEYRYLPFEYPSISLVVIDTGVRRELASSAYNERRQQCEDATKQIRELILRDDPNNSQAHKIETLRDITPEQFARYKQHLSSVLQRRAGYVIAENERVLKVVKLLEAGNEEKNIEAAGEILWQGHAGLRDEYEVSSVELDALVEIARTIPGVLGARMMGGGFGGCTINLVQNEAVEALRKAVEKEYPQRTGRDASIDISRAAAGPGYTFLDR
jgi:galactokinase